MIVMSLPAHSRPADTASAGPFVPLRMTSTIAATVVAASVTPKTTES